MPQRSGDIVAPTAREPRAMRERMLDVVDAETKK